MPKDNYFDSCQIIIIETKDIIEQQYTWNMINNQKLKVDDLFPIKSIKYILNIQISVTLIIFIQKGYLKFNNNVPFTINPQRKKYLFLYLCYWPQRFLFYFFYWSFLEELVLIIKEIYI